MSISLISTAQSNNPYSDFGSDYIESVNKIVGDIQENGFLGNDEAGLQHYQSLCMVDVQINPSIADEVYNLSNTAGLNFVDYINSVSNVSQEAKDFTIQIVQNLDGLSLTEKVAYYADLVDQINGSSLVDEEKEMNLKLISIAVYAYQNNLPGGEQNASRNNNNACTIEGPEGSGSANATTCVILAAGLGFYAGFQVCGGWCGVGGAIVFGVLTAIAVC